MCEIEYFKVVWLNTIVFVWLKGNSFACLYFSACDLHSVSIDERLLLFLSRLTLCETVTTKSVYNYTNVQLHWNRSTVQSLYTFVLELDVVCSYQDTPEQRIWAFTCCLAAQSAGHRDSLRSEREQLIPHFKAFLFSFKMTLFYGQNILWA